MQTILGAGGSIGKELAKSLKYFTDDIRLVSRHPQKINDTDQLFPADLTDREQLFKAVEGSQIVYLTIGLEYSAKVWQKLWPPLMQNVIDACIASKARLVFFDNVYSIGGDCVRHITEESPVYPTSKKGEVRAQIDLMLLDLMKTGKIKAIIARAPDFYGTDISKSILMSLIYKNLAAGKKAQWMFNARTRHSYIYTPDAGAAMALLGNTPDAYNQIWNLPTDRRSLTGEQWISLFAKEMGKKENYRLISGGMVRMLGMFIPFMKELYEMKYQFDRDYFFDSSKFEKYFKYQPTKYEAGVKAIVKELSQK
ncbi:MAG TPA: NAD-dependent epimerase/dehydratase family protein [Prolixibacteraceae bacterium]|jgi:nucleoside-diphosphate-sugar epimerase